MFYEKTTCIGVFVFVYGGGDAASNDNDGTGG